MLDSNKENSSLDTDKDAFKEIYEAYSDMVYNVALSYTKNVHDAEEITQDVFLSVFKNYGKYRAQAAFRTWIYRIGVNTSLNFLKRKKRQLVYKDIAVVDQEFIHPGVDEVNMDNSIKLFQVIETLPDSQRTAFILSYVEGLARQDVADVLETSLKAVESLLQRAKKNLRKKLSAQPSL